jgi:hypothetical protein
MEESIAVLGVKEKADLKKMERDKVQQFCSVTRATVSQPAVQKTGRALP